MSLPRPSILSTAVAVAFLLVSVTALPLRHHPKLKRSSLQGEGNTEPLNTYIAITQSLGNTDEITGQTSNLIRDVLLSAASSQSEPTDDDTPMIVDYSDVGIGYTIVMNDAALEKVLDCDDVMFVERDQRIEGAAFLYPIQLGYHTDRIDQRELPLDGQYNPPYTGEGVDIYIVDSGISYSHTLFGGRAQFGGYDYYGDDGKDCNGHGTHVAGLAGGSITGAATRANLYSIKVLDCNQAGTYSGLLAGINHIIDRAQKNPSRRSIISMSLIGPPSSSVDVALQRAYEAGVITVSAAGNYKDDACDYSPASSQHTITVGGSREKEDGLYWFDNSGTNWGKCVDMFAPGQWVRSASHESDDHLVSMSGTSMATPIVSGVVAMMLEEDPSLSPDEVKERMQERATKGALDFSVLPATVASDTPNLLVYTGRREPDPTSAPATQSTTTPTTQATTTPTTQATTQKPTTQATTTPTTQATTTPTTQATTQKPTTQATTTPTTQATTTPTTQATTQKPTTQATTTPTTQATTTPTTQATTSPTTQATTMPTTQATTQKPTTAAPTRPSIFALPTVSSQLSPAVLHSHLQLDIEARTSQGLTPTNVNTYTVGSQLYFTIVYTYVGKENMKDYIYFYDLPVDKAEDSLSALADGFQPITMAPYTLDGQPKLFVVLERSSEDTVLLLEKTKNEWSTQEASLVVQGYVPVSFRYRNVQGGSSMIYSIFKKRDDTFFRWDLTFSQLLNEAYYERSSFNFLADVTWEQMADGNVKYTAVFNKDRYGVTQFYVDARFDRQSFTSTHSLLASIGFHIKAATPLIIGGDSPPGFLGAYWR